MRWLAIVLLFASAAAFGAPLSPELELCLEHLRPGERARVEKALGRIDELPFYRAELEVDPEARKVKGRLVVTYPARRTTLDSLALRVTPNAAHPGAVRLSRATLNGQPVALEQPEPSAYRLALDPQVPPGASAVVEVSIEAKVPKAPESSARLTPSLGERSADHGAFLAAPEMMNLVGVLPWAAPGEPSNWLVSVTVPAGHRVHATGAALGEVPDRDGRVRFAFAAAVAREFPLFVSRGYGTASGKQGALTVESHFLEEDAEVGRKVLGFATSAVAELERRLGPLPYTHLRVVQARLTGGAGGMELPGLIVISTALSRGSQDPFAALGLPGLGALTGLTQPGGPMSDVSRLLERTLELTVAHEVAHQYFAMLVGSDPVEEPVVDEALAQSTALLYMEWKHGKEVAEQLRKTHLVTAYHLFRLVGGKDGPAARPTAEFDSSLEYAALVYGKAPLLHLELRKRLGAAAYERGLKAYVEAYRHKEACKECLVRILAKQNPKHAEALFALQRRWWEEARGDEDLGQLDLAEWLE